MLRWGGGNDKIVLTEDQAWDVTTNYKDNIYKNDLTNLRSVVIPGVGHKITAEGYNIFKEFLANP